MRRFTYALIACMILPVAAVSQEDQTLADIRQELVVFNVEIQKLKRELSTTGGAQAQLGAGSLLDRVNAIEMELQRLTGKTEELEFRINRIVQDGSNRIGDLEFRLVELEGGDVSRLGEASTLGGEVPHVSPLETADLSSEEEELASQEAADFERAAEALAQGDYQSAVDQFALFNHTYPGGPLSVRADMRRGEAFEKMGDTRSAAKAYLDGFSTDQTGRDAPEALFLLGAALGKLGQKQEACVTLAEVSIRFPQSSAVQRAHAEMQKIACQ